MKYPIGIQSFESLINDGYIYVDKTALIYQLVHTGRYYFLSRPRRFTGSLLQRAAGTVQGTGNGTARKRMDEISGTAFRFEHK